MRKKKKLRILRILKNKKKTADIASLTKGIEAEVVAPIEEVPAEEGVVDEPAPPAPKKTSRRRKKVTNKANIEE